MPDSHIQLHRKSVYVYRPHGQALSIAQQERRSKLPSLPCIYIKITMDIILYSAFWCGDCREAKRFLQRHNIPYKEVDIESTPGAAEAVIQQTGKRAIPQLVINGEWVQPYRPGEGFLYEEMSERLGINQT